MSHVLVLVAFGVAIAELVISRGRSLGGWAVALLALGLSGLV